MMGMAGVPVRDQYLRALLHEDIMAVIERRLGICADCGRPFLRVKRQIYCGKICSQRVRTRRFNERHGRK